MHSDAAWHWSLTPRSVAQVAELYRRGWSAFELAGLTGGNVLRVMEGAERVAAQMQKAGIPPVASKYDKRTDL